MISGSDEGAWPLAASVVYTVVWCLSFYGQIYENYRLKSVEGLSLNFFAFSVTGYTFYTIYLSIGAFTDLQGAGTVVIADLVFIYHTVFVLGVQLVQIIIYKKGKNSLSLKTVILIGCVTGLVVLETILTVAGVVEWAEYWNPLAVLGYAKLSMTFVKCTPEVYWNYKRKSTEGWSIVGVWLDLTGGAFSFASGGLNLQNGLNITKTLLGIISFSFGIVFCVQHYCLYPQRKAPADEKLEQSASLLSDGEAETESGSAGRVGGRA